MPKALQICLENSLHLSMAVQPPNITETWPVVDGRPGIPKPSRNPKTKITSKGSTWRNKSPPFSSLRGTCRIWRDPIVTQCLSGQPHLKLFILAVACILAKRSILASFLISLPGTTACQGDFRSGLERSRETFRREEKAQLYPMLT